MTDAVLYKRFRAQRTTNKKLRTLVEELRKEKVIYVQENGELLRDRNLYREACKHLQSTAISVKSKDEGLNPLYVIEFLSKRFAAGKAFAW